MLHKANRLGEEINHMPAEAERKRGAPKGNQNARKHGFYSRVLDEAEQLDFELATGVEGIDGEIALLRVKIKSILKNGARPHAKKKENQRRSTRQSER